MNRATTSSGRLGNLSDGNVRSCPICGSWGGRGILHRQRFLEGPFGEGYDVVMCHGCGATFADGIPDQAEMDRYYAEQSKYTYSQADGVESPWDFQRFETTVTQVAPFFPPDAHLLDVGCATGGLLSVFRRRGFENVLGLDPSAACSAAAWRLHKVEVRNGSFGDLAKWPARFDLILMLGVLEHLREARSAVLAAAALLKPGGMIYCAVPDVEGLADSINAPYQQFSVEHVNFFSAESLARLMASAGLVSRQTWRWTMEWREGVTEPIAAGLFGVDPPAAKLRGEHFDRISGPALERYLTACRDGEAMIIPKIEALVRSQEPILIWGAGTLARRLLTSTRLGEANISAFIDSNPHLAAKTLAGRPILAPDQARDRPGSILICSKAFEQEITETIRTKLSLPNPILRLDG